MSLAGSLRGLKKVAGSLASSLCGRPKGQSNPALIFLHHVLLRNIFAAPMILGETPERPRSSFLEASMLLESEKAKV